MIADFDFLWAVGSLEDMEGIDPGDFSIYQWPETYSPKIKKPTEMELNFTGKTGYSLCHDRRRRKSNKRLFF